MMMMMLRITHCVLEKKFLFPYYEINSLFTPSLLGRDGSGYMASFFFCIILCLWILTLSWPVNVQKNMANIQLYYNFMATIVRMLRLAAELALFSCNDWAL